MIKGAGSISMLHGRREMSPEQWQWVLNLGLVKAAELTNKA
jgi:hypothetical protein